MALLKNVKPEEVLLFTRENRSTLEATGATSANGRIKFLHTLVRGEDLLNFKTLSDSISTIKNGNLNQIIIGRGKYPPPINAISKQKRAIRCDMRKPRTRKIRRYTLCLTNINDYLTVLQGFYVINSMG